MNNLQKIIAESDNDEKFLNLMSDFAIETTDHNGEVCSIYSEQFSTALTPIIAFLHERDRKILEGVVEAIDKAVEDRASIKQVTDIIKAVLEK